MNKFVVGILCTLALLATGVVIAAGLAPGVELPPLIQPPSTEVHPGKVIWADLVTPDLRQAEDFYAGLFGWSFRPATGDSNFAVATLDGRPIAGIDSNEGIGRKILLYIGATIVKRDRPA